MARGQKQVELDLWFDIDGASAQKFLDLGQCSSLINRIALRQGYQYAVANMELVSDNTCQLQISRLPEHWPCINAWEKAYHVWRESQAQVLDVEPGIAGRYADFKIFMTGSHQALGVTANLIPRLYALNFGGIEVYDWDASEIQIPNDPAGGTTTGYNLHMLGPSSVTSKGLITGYAASRARPQQIDPNIVDSSTNEDWYRQAFDVGEDLEEIRADIEDDNDSPPYVLGTPGSGQSFYPGGSQQGIGTQQEQTLVTRLGTALAKDYGQGFTAPCGLLELNWTQHADANTRLRITMMPGSYKGHMARSMQSVN